MDTNCSFEGDSLLIAYDATIKEASTLKKKTTICAFNPVQINNKQGLEMYLNTETEQEMFNWY